MKTGPVFDFYEKVVVTTTDPSISEIDGEIAAVLGRAYGEDGRWYYAVSVYRTGVCWSCPEDALRSIAEFDRRETFYGGTSILVSQIGEVAGGTDRDTANGDS
jgi:Immunity protein 31